MLPGDDNGTQSAVLKPLLRFLGQEESGEQEILKRLDFPSSHQWARDSGAGGSSSSCSRPSPLFPGKRALKIHGLKRVKVIKIRKTRLPT